MMKSVEHCTQETRELLLDIMAKAQTGAHSSDQATDLATRTVLSPYRINPLGAHVDHQGGHVLAQPIDQCTVLSFQAVEPEQQTRTVRVTSLQPDWRQTPCELIVTGNRIETASSEPAANWQRYLIATVTAFCEAFTLEKNLVAVVDGTLIGAGLSSSASVILAYLAALEQCSTTSLSPQQKVELCRIVENQHMGLNNGVQDQMSIVFGRKNALAVLDVNRVSARMALSPPSVSEVGWVILYSGYSRELINSGFNTRVAECAEAASLLQPGCQRLGDVEEHNRGRDQIQKLPPPLARRVLHFNSETNRVRQGATAWEDANWTEFGELMNASCHSSIHHYESGSDALVEAHRIASATPGVYGSRFGGGGYGGCLIILAERYKADEVSRSVLQDYLQHFPDRHNIATSMIAEASDGIQIHTADHD